MIFSAQLHRVPVDPLEWQISQDTANAIVACLANTVGAAESVLRVAATGHDKRLFFKVFTLDLDFVVKYYWHLHPIFKRLFTVVASMLHCMMYTIYATLLWSE